MAEKKWMKAIGALGVGLLLVAAPACSEDEGDDEVVDEGVEEEEGVVEE